MTTPTGDRHQDRHRAVRELAERITKAARPPQHLASLWDLASGILNLLSELDQLHGVGKRIEEMSLEQQMLLVQETHDQLEELRNFASCSWCAQRYKRDDEGSIREHAMECVASPLVREIVRLRVDVATLYTLVERGHFFVALAAPPAHVQTEHAALFQRICELDGDDNAIEGYQKAAKETLEAMDEALARIEVTPALRKGGG